MPTRTPDGKGSWLITDIIAGINGVLLRAAGMGSVAAIKERVKDGHKKKKKAHKKANTRRVRRKTKATTRHTRKGNKARKRKR